MCSEGPRPRTPARAAETAELTKELVAHPGVESNFLDEVVTLSEVAQKLALKDRPALTEGWAPAPAPAPATAETFAALLALHPSAPPVAESLREALRGPARQ